ncbi:TIGR00269 family protein [Methanococcoides vulcani]|uniref:TIGR00269 family protein n=1 Tax=Methanococcoides vulcani TaxID=1353158 RepID=A0A1H9YN89_9EURY|nr:TIGR00269 family protein [Methanococcoides vulcani]SES70519.1 TIGR00269 family protein [Methanococcoides vulcani]
MPIKCMKCNKDAIIFQKYSGMHLCRKHFIEDVERKIKLTIRKQYNVEKGDIIAVALSGGKDSIVLLHILHKIFSKRRDVEIVAITIDEGIEGYREVTLEKARKLTSELGIRHIVRSFKDEYDKTLDELVAQERELGACSYCGVLRKSLMNKIANEIGATKLATGHNLDDEAQTIMMNHLGGDVERMIRLSPPRALEGLVLRAKPLRKVPEKEIALYAIVNDLPFDMSECPYAHEALRGEVRDMINDFEVRHPGTKYSIMRGFDKMVGILGKEFPQASLTDCRVCGEPCTAELCQACKLLGRS